MTVALAVLFFICEAAIFAFLILKIHRLKKVSIKDTAVYPFLFVISALVLCTAKARYGNYAAWWEAIPSALSASVNTIVLSLDVNLVKVLAQQNIPLLVDYLLLYTISTVAMMSLFISLTNVALRNELRFLVRSREITYVVGFDDNAKMFLKNLSEEEKRKTCVVLDRSTNSNFNNEKLFCDANRVKYTMLPYGKEASFVRTMKKLTRHHSKKKYCIVCFFSNDTDVYNCVVWAKAFLKQGDLYDKNIRFVISASVSQSNFVRELICGTNFATVDDGQGNTLRLRDESRGAIGCFDKYDILAYDFVSRHNFAKYFPRELVAENCTVRECDINLYMLGFGKVNKALLKDILIETQFVTTENDKLVPKPLNVTVYDSADSIVDTDLSYGLLKYNKKAFDDKQYLELPRDYVSDITYRKHNVGNVGGIGEIYDEIRQRAKKKPQVNYFIVSVGDDFTNCLLTQKLQESLSPLTNCRNNYFVRTENGLQLPAGAPNTVFFGSNKQLYSYDNVVADRTFALAKMAACMYLKKPITAQNLNAVWGTLTPKKQQSNLYAVASIPFKLSMLGFDSSMTAEEFAQRYRREQYSYSDKLAKAGSAKLPARDVLAFCEHERWNAFELSVGTLPMKKADCYDAATKTFRNKTPDELYHLCITTAQGLVEYYKLVQGFVNDGADATPDVIQYDYDMLDNLPETMQNVANVLQNFDK